MTSASQKIKWKIVVHEGRDLPSRDSNGLSDPFVVMSWFYINGTKKVSLFEQKSTVIQKSLNPTWNNEEFEFEFLNWKQFSGASLEIVVWDKNVILFNTFIGRLKPIKMEGINTKPIPFAEKQWFELFPDEKNKYTTSGEICLSYSYSGVPDLLKFETMDKFVRTDNIEGVKTCLANGYQNPEQEQLDKFYKHHLYPVWKLCLNQLSNSSFEMLKYYVENGGQVTPEIKYKNESVGQHLISILDRFKPGVITKFVDYFFEIDAITSNDLTPWNKIVTKDGQYFWQKVHEKNFITEKILCELLDTNYGCDLSNWIYLNLDVKPTNKVFQIAALKNQIGLVNKILPKLDENSIEVTSDMIINAESEELQNLLRKYFSGPVTVSSEDLFKLQSNSFEILQNSIDNIDVNVRNHENKLILEDYLEKSWFEACKLLFNTGKLEIPEDKKVNLLKLAIQSKNNPLELVQLLLQTNFTILESESYLFLELAIKASDNQLEILKLLHDVAHIQLNLFENEKNSELLKIIVENENLFSYIIDHVFKDYNKDNQCNHLISFVHLSISSKFASLSMLASIDHDTVRDCLLKLREKSYNENQFFSKCSTENLAFMNEIIPIPFEYVFKNPSGIDCESILLKSIEDGSFIEKSKSMYTGPLNNACINQSWNLAKILVQSDCCPSPYKRGSSLFRIIENAKAEGKISDDDANDILNPLLKRQEDAKEHTENIMNLLSNDSTVSQAIDEINKDLPISGVVTRNGESILHSLVEKLPDNDDSSKIIRRVLELHGNPNAESEGNRRTPFLLAVLKGKEKIVKELIPVSDFQVKDSENSNMYHLNAVQGSSEIFELLNNMFSYDCMSRDRNNFGQNPGQLCRQMVTKGGIGHIYLDKKMNAFFGGGALF